MYGFLLALCALAVPYDWKVLPIDGGGSIECLACSPHDPALVLAGSDVGGFHRSTDGGRTWQTTNRGLRSDADVAVADIAFHPTDPHCVYAATGKCFGRPKGDWGGLLVSGDAGLTWTVRSRAVRFSGHGEPRQRGDLLLTDPHHPDRLWAATAWDGVKFSEDRGHTWTDLGLPHTFLTALGRGADGTLYAAAIPQEDRPGGLFVLAPQAGAWRRVYESAVRDLAVAADDPRRVLITTPDVGLLLTEDGGATWVNVTPAGFVDRLRADTVAFSPSHPRIGVATGIERHWRQRHPDIYLTLDGGHTWQPMVTSTLENVSTGDWWVSRGWFGFNPHCLAFDPHNPQRVFIGDWYTVWGTHDGAATWFSGHRGLRTTVVRQIVPDPLDPGRAWLGLADVGAFRADLDPFGVTPLGANVSSIGSVAGLAARRGPNGTRLFISRGAQVWYQDELGRWDAATGEAPANLRGLLALPTGDLLAEVEGQPLHISRDQGGSWRPWGVAPSVAGRPVPLRLPAFLDATGASAVAWHPELGVWLTRDAGATWSDIGAGLPTLDLGGQRHKHLVALAAAPGPPPVLYAANRLAVWRSLDLGRTWERVFPRPVRAVAVDSRSGRVVVAAAGYWFDPDEPGLFVSDDRGETWDELTGDWPVHRQITTLAVDPRAPGRIWVGTSGNGAVVGEPAR